MNQVQRALVSMDGSLVLQDSVLLLCPDENLRTGIDDFSAYYSSPTSLEQDLLTFASTIYACDLAFKRGQRENFIRNIEVTIPVVNHQAFERLKDDLIEILWILSHDSWDFTFKRMKGSPEEAADWPQTGGKTLLFSGGLDSLAGAVDLIEKFGPDQVLLASHITANRVTSESQNNLAGYLEKQYSTSLNRLVVRTGGRKYRNLDFPSDDEREETQRTRSFMFLAIAALGARRSGCNEVVMIAENGQMAIHLPLSAARIGAFSTHTAHPDFVHKVGLFFSRLLDFQIIITNPYLYKSKAEVVAKLVTKHPDAIKMSVSCWRGSRLSKAYNHCGDCVPCLIRRVSLEYHGLVLPEYNRDVLALNVATLPPQDEGKRNAIELAEFAYTFNSRTDAEISLDYPDLVSENIDFEKAVTMYRKFAAEAQQVLSGYPGMSGVLPTTGTPLASNLSQSKGSTRKSPASKGGAKRR